VTSVEPEHRAVCLRCRRPESVCYCRHVTTLPTRTRVVLLQHPRERDMPIGTARMASLCLENAEIHEGVEWGGSKVLERALSDPSRPPILLYPGEGAIDVVKNPPPGPVTLIVVDGTWWQSKKVVKQNPVLARLPRYAFTPPAPSEYRIRKEPNDTCVSTIEALMHVLGSLEGEPERFRAMMIPFRAMIDAQLHAQAHREQRLRHPRKPKPPRRPYVPELLRERPDDLLCVMGEANAWPYCEGGLKSQYPDELVHWVAARPKTGEIFDTIIRPRAPVAPNTPYYVGLEPEEIAAGVPLEESLERWRAFVRESDVVCSWGHYPAGLFLASGGLLPPSRLDLRQVARTWAQGKVGTLEDFAARIEAPFARGLGRGRGGKRLDHLVSVARHLCGNRP
jgi:DTW domain-containing protein YfiP